jgi:hypothetical protein
MPVTVVAFDKGKTIEYPETKKVIGKSTGERQLNSQRSPSPSKKKLAQVRHIFGTSPGLPAFARANHKFPYIAN